jgi:hypothetical protein
MDDRSRLEGAKQMALYKYSTYLEKSDSQAFDQISNPSTAAPYPGIYRCEGCGHEIAIAASHTLPPQNHHQHTYQQGSIRWKLVVSHKAY